MARPKARARVDSASKPARRGPIQERRDAALTTVRHRDGWDNVFTGLGTERDKRRGAGVVVLTLDYNQAHDLYRGDDMAAKIIDEPSREATRRWLDVQIQDDKVASELVEKEERKLKAKKLFQRAMAWSRAFGGAALLMGVEDGQDPDKPVNEKNITKIRFLTLFSAQEVYPASWYADPFEEKYGLPETYWVTPQGFATNVRTTRVHESRLLRFDGVKVSRRQEVATRGWGDSVLVRVLEVLADFGMAWGSAGHLVQDFSQAIFRMKGLIEALSSGREQLVQARLEAIEMGRSVVRAALIDAGDSSEGDPGEGFERKTTSIAGLAELLDRFAVRLAAAADMPISRLFGQTPGGLSSDDKAGTTWWTERIEGLQEENLLEPAEQLTRYILLSKEGPTKGKEPENWSIRFRPLRQLDPVQEATRRLSNAQADAAYVQAGVLMAEEVATSRFGGDAYGEDIVLADELRRKMEETPEPPPDDGIDPPKGPPGAPVPPSKNGKAAPPAAPPAKAKPGAEPPAKSAKTPAKEARRG